MLLRLVRPMDRTGSSKSYFVQRIPADVRARAIGMTLQVPVNGAIVPVKIKDSTQSIRLSLRTRDVGETKTRQAEVASYIERVIRAGIAMLIITFLPVVWQIAAVPEDDSPGFGGLALMMLPPPLVVILVGIGILIYRHVKRSKSPANASRIQ